MSKTNEEIARETVNRTADTTDLIDTALVRAGRLAGGLEQLRWVLEEGIELDDVYNGHNHPYIEIDKALIDARIAELGGEDEDPI